MKPHRMVEAGHLYFAVSPADAMRQERGIQQRHVAGIGEDAGVQYVVIGLCAVGAHPYALSGTGVALA